MFLLLIFYLLNVKTLFWRCLLKEQGIEVAHIQKLLGHSNISTTLIYTHITKDAIQKINSPLDD